MSRAAPFVLAALLAAPALAQVPADAGARRALLIATVEAHGCRLTDAQADAVLPPLGFVKDDTRPIFQALISEGLAEADGDALVLKTENCL